ncbi:nickel pincer cofactor biosynthesis protein LarC [Blautia schinkii]|nr:nickel pincer cofactor biosynthesis protein LarC [Blautia schinkii]
MNLHTLYLECYSGISGDMLVGALLDLGASFQVLCDELKKLPVSGYELKFDYEQKCGVYAGAFRVPLESDKYVDDGHHNDGHCDDSHEHHSHAHTHSHTHSHRHYSDIREMIEASELSEGVKQRALSVFHVLAEAEAKVHGKSVEDVAFHEVGAVDSIVDIVGTAICLENLGIEKILVSPMHEGQGHTWCQHGKIPVPVPAVLELVQQHGLPLRITEVQGEMITPTGAAVVAALADLQESPAKYQIRKVGIGCGEKDFPHANILRAMLLEPLKKESEPDTVWVLETNVDDCTGEQLGYAIERLLDAGARDACAMPLYMKKHRPAFLLQVICDESQVEQMEAILFRETTSIGLRKYQTKRTVLARRIETMETPHGTIKVKCCTHGAAQYCYPEYESLKAIAQEKGLPYQQVYRDVMELIQIKSEEENLGR